MHFWFLSHEIIFLSHGCEETFRPHSQIWALRRYLAGWCGDRGRGWVAHNQSSKTRCVTTSRVVSCVLLVSDSRDTWLAAVTRTATVKKLSWARPWARDKSAPDASMTVTAVPQWDMLLSRILQHQICCERSLVETKKAGSFFFSGPLHGRESLKVATSGAQKSQSFLWQQAENLSCLPGLTRSVSLLS